MGLCSQWQRHLCQSLNHRWGHLSVPFLEGQGMATARHLYCSLSKGSEICLPSFYPRAVLPVAQAGCISAGATPFLFLSSANTLTGPMSHTVISLSNDYSAIPLLLSPENVLIFFCSNMDTLRVLQGSKSWFLFAHQCFTISTGILS